MDTKIFVCQSNYIPWKGYFDAINSSDYFVLYDVVQYTKNDWRNRNIIKTRQSTEWLTIPVRQKQLAQTIDETEITQYNWHEKHWTTLKTVYGRSPYFKQYEGLFADLYLKELKNFKNLSDINEVVIKTILNLLGSSTKVIPSKELREDLQFNFDLDRNERLIDICTKLKGNVYLSGTAAKVYLEESAFEKKGIKVIWTDYSGYPSYPQLSEPFEHGVSILDLIFNLGPDATKYMKSFSK